MDKKCDVSRRDWRVNARLSSRVAVTFGFGHRHVKRLKTWHVLQGGYRLNMKYTAPAMHNAAHR